MRRWAAGCAVLVLLAAACDGDPRDPVTAADASADADAATDPGETDVWTPPTQWPAEVTRFNIVSEWSTAGDLADGEAVALSWAYAPGVSCLFVNEVEPFSGNVVLYALATAMPNSREMTITAVPAQGVDLNLFAYQLPTDAWYAPPDVPSATSCVASFDAAAGEPESASLQTVTSATNVLFGVAGPAGVTSGAFTVTVTLD